VPYSFADRHEFDQHIEDVRRLRYPSPLDSDDSVEEVIWVKLTGNLVADCSLCDQYYLDSTLNPPQWVALKQQVLALRPDLGAPTYPTTKIYAAKYASQREDTDKFWGVYVLIGAENTSLPYSSIPYGTDIPPRFSSVSWNDLRDADIAGCTFTKVYQTHTLYVDQAGRLGIVDTISTVSYPITFSLHGTGYVTIPDETGTFTGTSGTCSVTVSGTVPGGTFPLNLTGVTICP